MTAVVVDDDCLSVWLVLMVTKVVVDSCDDGGGSESIDGESWWSVVVYDGGGLSGLICGQSSWMVKLVAGGCMG